MSNMLCQQYVKGSEMLAFMAGLLVRNPTSQRQIEPNGWHMRKKYHNGSENEWNKVVFSDESPFSLTGSSDRVFM
jgi:hypothetical protein